MKIYPAIDLKAGQCVRLYQGCYEKITTYPTEPLAMAEQFVQQGADTLHIVDLDGAKCGASQHADLIVNIKKQTRACIQTGGGIRTYEQVRYLLQQGVDRVILGSIAISEPQKVLTWLKAFGAERIVLAFDIRMNEVQEPIIATHGWQENSAMSLWQALALYQDTIKHVLCTDIQCDGTLQGPNKMLYQACVARYPHLAFQASGGVSQLNDFNVLKQIKLASVIVGKALYENKFKFSAALTEVALC